jgi:hypothetical protein
MYTGGNGSPSERIRVTDLIPKRDETNHHGPGPITPVNQNYLTDDHLKVNNQFNNIGIAGEPSRFIVMN